MESKVLNTGCWDFSLKEWMVVGDLCTHTVHLHQGAIERWQSNYQHVVGRREAPEESHTDMGRTMEAPHLLIRARDWTVDPGAVRRQHSLLHHHATATQQASLMYIIACANDLDAK